MSRSAVLSDAHWAQIEPLKPVKHGRHRPFRDHSHVLEGIIYRFRTGIAWRDLPAEFGPWQSVWQRHKRFSTDGTWDRIHAHLIALDVFALDPHQRVEDVSFAPGEPTPERGGIQGVCARSSERARHGSELSGCHRIGLERQQQGHRCYLAKWAKPAQSPS